LTSEAKGKHTTELETRELETRDLETTELETTELETTELETRELETRELETRELEMTSSKGTYRKQESQSKGNPHDDELQLGRDKISFAVVSSRCGIFSSIRGCFQACLRRISSATSSSKQRDTAFHNAKGTSVIANNTGGIDEAG
jgi:hypothetical protein